MKRLAIAISIVVLSLPLLAEDSPLVRAAKATGRLNKKPRVVITNDTLVTSGGHLSTNGSTEPIAKTADAYANAPANTGPARTAAAPAPQPVTATNTVQPTTATTYQPMAAQTARVGTVSTTSVSYSGTTAVSYSGTTQPQVAPVKPPQP